MIDEDEAKFITGSLHYPKSLRLYPCLTKGSREMLKANDGDKDIHLDVLDIKC